MKTNVQQDDYPVFDEGGPAFPILNDANKDYMYINKGLSRRDWFAGMALQGLLANPSNTNLSWAEAASDAGEYADHMIEERKNAE